MQYPNGNNLKHDYAHNLRSQDYNTVQASQLNDTLLSVFFSHNYQRRHHHHLNRRHHHRFVFRFLSLLFVVCHRYNSHSSQCRHERKYNNDKLIRKINQRLNNTHTKRSERRVNLNALL